MTDEELDTIERIAHDAREVAQDEGPWAERHGRHVLMLAAEVRRLRALEKVTREYYAALEANHDADAWLRASEQTRRDLDDALLNARVRMDAAWRAK